MAGAGTRERIVDAAIAMFNERGTRAISTNHIAEACGISPGNLYYHFRNKEEIVLAAYERALTDYDAMWDRAGFAVPTPDAVIDLMEDTFKVEWRYRFFQREAAALVQADEVLAEKYRGVQLQRLVMLRALVDEWVAAGVLVDLDDEQREDIVTATYVLGESWVGWLESMGHSDDESQFHRGVRLLRGVVKPYLVATAAVHATEDQPGGGLNG
ncbi:MAG: TetR/AcrR family transcriptional regulator [Coriobacteriia bacterium]|nr:TetR/AcrR family transcriptional regulator [Coriobacteriia bacterium]MBN2821715.1 TetR/AcrR family transcriptional regulator [Coriobacteriia bacterium]